MYSSFADAYAISASESNPDENVHIDHNGTTICSLKIIDCDNSYHKIYQKGRIIHYVGVGKLLNHGHPAGGQQWLSQEIFHSSWSKGVNIPIFRKINGLVEYMGLYRIKDIVKKLSMEGFPYFHVILQRI